jgi:hypothetical protein
MNIRDFLLQNKEALSEYFKQLKINHNKIEIKYGMSPINVSIVFYITSEFDDSISNFEDKVNALFNSDTDLTEINNFISQLSSYEFVKGSTLTKIKENPAVHIFQVTVKKKKG